MKQSISLSWMGNMAFETELNGHRIVLDTSPEFGGEDLGVRPKLLMLVALAGCSGMDVASILKKMKVEYKTLKIIVEGDLTEQHPKHFIRMNILFEFTGQQLPLDKLQKAVNLSLDNYCGVNAVYKKAMEVTHEIRILDI